MGDSSAESDVDECSGISQPTLLEQLKGILDEYRNDVQIIKELVQNADDAGASEMKILYIGSNVNEEQNQSQNTLKGPALVFYNDAEFSKLDWQGIKSIYSSVKRDDPLKVGRFGLGFKSVFHMTDNPCIVSGEYILFINPLEKDSSQVCISVKLKNLKRSKRLDISSIMNALNGLFGFSERILEDGSYPGTLFWFSLRQTPSQLSSDIYHDHQVDSLLEAFIEESCRSLIFLKTLCSVHIYVELKIMQYPPRTKCRQSKNNETSLLNCLNFGRNTECYSAVISNANKERKSLIESRRDVSLELEGILNPNGIIERSGNRMSIPESSKYWVFDVIIETNRRSHNKNVNLTKSRWLIVTYLKGKPISNETQVLLEDEELKYPPVVGLAAPISETGEYTNISTHVFCYQPLPQENTSVTGLPVHINAYFALGQSRRNIRWPDIDKDGQELIPDDNKIKWNLALRTEVLPYAYCHLCDELINLSEKINDEIFIVNAVYNIIPDLRNSGEHWMELAKRLLLLLGEKRLIHTKSNDGVWLEPKKALLMNEQEFNPLSKEAQDTVYSLLCKDNRLVSDVPEHVIYSLDKVHHEKLTFVTPRLLREHLHKHTTYKDLDFKTKIHLMKFILLDNDDDGIENIELVPLADGTFTSFSNKNVYSEPSDVMKLFPGKENMFLHGELEEETRQRLEQLPFTSMNDVDAEKLLSAMLIENFKTRKSDCLIVEDKKWIKWIEEIWLFIQNRFMKHIATFEVIPLFPIINCSENTRISKVKLISLQSLLLHLPPDQKIQNERKSLEESFQFLSVYIVEFIPKWISRTITEDYLFEDSGSGITLLFEKIEEKNIRNFNENKSETHSSNFLNFLSCRLGEISENNRIKLEGMKLFKGLLKRKQMSVLSISESKNLYAGSSYPVPYPIDVIVVKSKKEISFAKNLGGTVVPELEMIDRTFKKLDEFSQEEKDTFIEWVIGSENFENINVQCHLRDIAFLRTNSKKLHKPCELFDPENELLIKLFMDADVFPDWPLGRTNLKKLRVLGLKTVKDVTKSDIHSICDAIDKKSDLKNEICVRQCIALRTIMENLSGVFEKQYVWQKRCIILEQIGEEPKLYSAHNTGEFVLLRPSDIKSSKHSNLIKTEMYLIDSNIFPNLSQCFEWEKPPSDQQVIKHLFNIVEHYSDNLKAGCLFAIAAIYNHLSQSKHDVKKALADQFSSRGNMFVWTGNGFQSPDHVYTESTEGDIELQPFLQLIPSEVKQFADFFNRLGCRRTIDAAMYLDTLDNICAVSVKQEKPRSDKMLIDMTVAILNKVMEDFLKDVKTSGRVIFFPVQNYSGILKMRPTSECTYCDANWLKGIDFDIDEDIAYVHERVPERTAAELGVPSLRQQILSSSEAFEEWGQEEPLTRRLRNLLNDGYVDGFSVAKELLQNADDAGAKSLKIMYDERENNDFKTQLLSDNMAELQGPAIWVYNDALFTEDDFKNIKQLNAATKMSDSSKIGRFGLGFCAVYNVTDVPSFFSGSNMVMFDPHTTHLGRALPGNSPGLRINFQLMKNKKLLKRLRNQFKPFDGIFGCQLTNCDEPFYNGTLFRLPLRNRASDICDNVYTKRKVEHLFETIKTLSSNMLLFNQSVEKIELYNLDQNDVSKQVLLFTTSKQVLQTTCERPLPHSILKEASQMKKRDILGIQQLRVLQEVSIEVKTIADKDAAFINMKPTTVQNKWLVSWSTGNKPQSLQIAKREKGALLLGAVAVPVQSNGNTDAIISFDKIPNHFYQKGHYYFFLPLPIEHGLPFHINGQFAVTPDRQALRTSSEGERNMIMKKWNKCLMEDAVTKSLLHLLMELPNLVDLSKYHYQQLWPTRKDYMLKYLCQSFYQHIVHKGRYAVFEKDGIWFDISKCRFIEREFRQSYVGEIALKAFNVITLPSDDVVVDVRDDIYDFLLSAGTELITDKTVSAVTFFTKYFIPQLDKFDASTLQKEERNCLIKYAIDLNDVLVNVFLTEKACIPTQPHGRLKRPCQLVDKTSKLAKLFSISDEYFPLEMFSKVPTTKYLHKLGMVYEQLTNDMVLFSASSVEQIQNQCSVCAFERSSALLDYLGEKELYIHRDTFEELQHIKFVPVSSKPEMWPFTWKSDSINKEHHPKEKCKKHGQQGPESIIFDQIKDLYCWKLRNIVGCVSLVLHEKICIKNTELLNALGVHSKLDLMTALKQLLLMSETRAGKDNDKYFNEIYELLDIACTYKDLPILINSKLQNKKVVWVDGLLTFPEKVAENRILDCSPHLFSLQRSPLKEYAALRKCLGIQKSFSAEIFAQTLHNIKESVSEHPVQSNNIQTILNLLECFKMASGPAIFEGVVYGPDENCILRDCKTMCFNDFDDVEKSETMNYSHPDMSSSLAKALGVKPKLLHSIEENSEDFEYFYQDEPLITRIQNLIEGYPCDIGIFKELLQNADDAKASEMHFLLDFDTHPIQNVFYEQYGSLQGPALCVFNNSAFSKEDLLALTMLGRGNKSEDMFKTGRFGVGFNAVYNLTDVPSLLTWGGDIEHKETLCFFDPMARFIPSVTKSKPGKRYINVAHIRKHSNDVLKGFHENYFKKFSGQTGTIFRLPLRSRVLAKVSEIKQDPIEVDMVFKILDKFSTDLKNVILFLKHLDAVKITVHLKGEYTDIFTIERCMNKPQTKRYCDLIQNQKKFSQYVSHCSQNMLTFPFHSAVCEMTLKETFLTTEGRSHHHNDYIVLHTTGFKYPKDIPTLLCEKIKGRNIGLLPSGAVAVRKISITTENEQCLAYCFLPLPVHTGLPVHVHGYFALDENRRTLWKSKDDKTCHKSLWNSVLLEQVIAPAYSLLVDYIRKSMIEPQTNQWCKYTSVSDHLKYYLSVLPTDNLASDYYWKHLTKYVYKELVRDYVPFLSILKTSIKQCLTGYEDLGVLSWTPLKIEGHKFPAYRNDAPLFNKKNNFFRDLEILESIKLKSVTISDQIQHSMAIAECAIESLLPSHMINYLTSFNSNNVDRCDIKIDTDVAKTIIRNSRNVLDLLTFCMQDHEAFCNDLMNIPLFLTMDGVLRTLPKKGYVFVETVARFCCFFPSAKKRFLDSKVANLVCRSIKASNVLKPFTLHRFVELLAYTEMIQSDQSILSWDTSPSVDWMQTFWCFFYATFEREHYRCSTSSDFRKNVRQHLDIIKKIPIIPVFDTSQSNSLYLVHPEYVKNLINLKSFVSMPFLHETIGDINILQLHTEMLPDPYRASMALSLQELLMSVLPDFSHPEEILTCLHLNIEKVRNCSLSATKSTTILKYFAAAANASLLKAEMIGKLMDLPLFQSHFEDIVSLSQYSVIFVAPPNIPLDGLEELARRSNILFLKDIGLNDFYKMLDITMKSLVDIYVEYIIPNHALMESSAFFRHMIFLAQSVYSEKCNIINVLKVTPFINVASRRVLVRDLFDPDVELFTYMCTESELVPLALRDPFTLKMLRKVGLQTTLTIPLIEKFANTIQADIQQERQDAAACNSDLLLRLLFNMPETFFVQENFSSIKKRTFVKPLKVDNELQAIHPQYNPQGYICLDGSVLSCEKLSCWTSSNLLPESVNRICRWKSFKTILDKLGIRVKPTFEQLLIHCKHIGRSSKDKSKPTVHIRLPSVMHYIYNCLEHYKQSEDINEADFLKLCDVPIIYHKGIKDTFTARQTVISCKNEEEIRPLINKCPSEYAQHHQLFCLLGCWKDTCCDMYGSVLFALRNHVDESGQLLPKPQADAVKALGLMFKHLCQLTTEAKLEKQNQYLLSENMTLRKARTLVINDNRYFSDAIRKDRSIRCSFLYSFDKLNEFHLRTESCIDCLKYLPENIRPHLLTNLAKRKVNLDNIKVKENGPANLLNEFVHSREFIHGYFRLVRHVLKHNTLSNDIQRWSNSVETKIADTVQNITFKHVTGIQTMLFFKCVEDKNAGKELAVENTKEAGLVHLEKRDDRVILYFDTSNPVVWFDKVKLKIALFLNELVDGKLQGSFFVHLMELINLKDDPSRIPIYLSQNSIDDFRSTVEIDENPIYPVPGTFVPRKWHKYLDNDFGIFQSYEYKYVALEVDDPALAASDDNDEDQEESSNMEPTYIFVHIIRKADEVNNSLLFQEYVIDDGSETTYTVQAYRLYKFTNLIRIPVAPLTDNSCSSKHNFMSKGRTDTANLQVVLYERQPSGGNGNSTTNQDIKEIRKEIREYLTLAWTQPETIRRKLVIRLIRKWHPDKNPNNVEFCTKVFQYIQQCLDRLEKGQALLDDDDDKKSQQASGSSTSHSASHWDSSFYGKYWNRNRRRTEDFDEFDGFARSSYHGSSRFTFSNQKQEPYCWISEARRWFRQAVSDQYNARIALENGITLNWVCYMSHQAVEKSLKAAWYAKDANKIHNVKYSHDLTAIASGLSSTLVSMARELSNLTGEHTRMRYPDTMCGQVIPSNAYNRQTAIYVISKAQEIQDFVQQHYGLR